MEFSALDQLLAYVHVANRDRKDMGQVAQWMSDAGFEPREINEAWLKARQSGYTKATGLGDVLTASGISRGNEVALELSLIERSMIRIRVVRTGERVVSAVDATSGMIREEAFSDEGVWAGLVRTAPMRPSGWHHHGDYDTYVYVASGKLLFEFGPEGGDVVEAGPGDFVHVPKRVVHRESNPSSEEGVISLVRTGSGPPVTDVDGPQ